jgi:hypothetical protein
VRSIIIAALLLLPFAVAAPARAQTAEELVPFEKLEQPLRDELWKVCQRYTVRRRVPERGVACTTDTYEWLLQRLGLASAAARKLGLGTYVIEDRAAPVESGSKVIRSFSIDDTEGAFAKCDVVFEERGRIVVVARGTVEGTLLPKTHGTGVIIVRWREDSASSKRVLTDCFVFFRVANNALHRVTQPFSDALGKILGGKLDGLVGCATSVSQEIERDPGKVHKALEESGKVPAEVVADFRKKFLLN